ncbi:MAG: GTPase domain-containing protein [Deltaproteobacteria bacterium]|nr:GTPase domain-containing protein [Deltaproteobacteria bacterium]MBW2019329.1 GTPase domain-containing protein [Deltaproteobacteria bacterium]MBW2074377.1 GTPase domain-containing protein [Deltaproteobacteria bacterium]RLB82308.1 MAG: GTPase [Deltaproteobacteria bacterium]
MAELSEKEKKMVVKVVYYGPALSGKTTNLMQLHDILNPARCGEFMTFETKGDRTLFFDFLPLMITSESDFRIKIKLFTVPGQVAHDATRKAVLSRADAVVFVADSQISQSMSNFESFDNLEKNAGRVGLDFDNLPLVVQFNKRDLRDIISEEEVLDRWRPTGLPITFSSALYGRGVKETFEIVLKQIYQKLNNIYRLKGKYLVTENNFLSMIPR